MRYLTALSSLLALSSTAFAASVPPSSSQKKSYSGYKVIRLSVGQDVAKINDLIDKLGLTTWMGAPRQNGRADVVIPPGQVAEFEAQTKGMKSVIMHDDLGRAISEQEGYNVYAGECSTISIYDGEKVWFC